VLTQCSLKAELHACAVHTDPYYYAENPSQSAKDFLSVLLVLRVSAVRFGVQPLACTDAVQPEG